VTRVLKVPIVPGINISVPVKRIASLLVEMSARMPTSLSFLLPGCNSKRLHRTDSNTLSATIAFGVFHLWLKANCRFNGLFGTALITTQTQRSLPTETLTSVEFQLATNAYRRIQTKHSMVTSGGTLATKSTAAAGIIQPRHTRHIRYNYLLRAHCHTGLVRTLMALLNNRSSAQYGGRISSRDTHKDSGRTNARNRSRRLYRSAREDTSTIPAGRSFTEHPRSRYQADWRNLRSPDHENPL